MHIKEARAGVVTGENIVEAEMRAVDLLDGSDATLAQSTQVT
jgi:hypothetical protein